MFYTVADVFAESAAMLVGKAPKQSSIQDDWQGVLGDFTSAGDDIRWAISEAKIEQQK